jgi:EpsD family peptidyl-prolyl cis-trans isomerase
MTNKNTTKRQTVMTATVVSSALLLAACTGHKKDATQSAARVDGTEITVHQINYRLQRERGLRPDQQEEAGRKILEQLIDEQLVVEKAEKNKVDLQPGAQQALDAARREVLARSYVEQASQSVAAPSDQAMHAYYDANPALFSSRRIFTMQEYLAKVPEAQIPALRAMVEGGKPTAEVEAWFKANNVPFRGQQSTHPAEQIPLNALKTLAAVQDGHGLVASAADQVHVTYVTASTSAPVAFDKARQAIGQYLSIESRRKATEGNLSALRSVAKVTYSAPYESLAASASTFSIKDIEAASQPVAAEGTRVTLPVNTPSGVQVSLPDSASSRVQVNLPAVSQTPGVRVSLPDAAASRVEVRLPPQSGGDAGKK